MSAPLRRLRRGHRLVAALLLNTLLLLIVVNGALSLVFWLKDRRGVVVDMYDGLDDATFATLYPGRSRADVTALWKAIALPFAYEPFTEFRERPRTGPWVNVDPAGFRHVADQRPWPPDPERTNVFVFGGSTTFGYGVADDDTIASRLQPLLLRRRPDVSVYNFARGYYYSTQERLLFEQLVSAGHVPTVAIFIDGLNDFCYSADESAVTPRLAPALDGRPRTSFMDWVGGTAIGRAVSSIQDRIGAAAPPTTELGEAEVRHIIDRYLENKRLIESASAAHGVTPVFVWQPVPMYKYDPQYHLFAGRGFFGTTAVRGGYAAMAEHVRAHPVGGHFMWLADVQEELREPLYVDIVHYAPRFAARLAALIDAEVGALIAEAGAARGR